MADRITADAFHLWTALDEVVNSPAGVSAGPYDGKWHRHDDKTTCIGCAYEEMSSYFRPIDQRGGSDAD